MSGYCEDIVPITYWSHAFSCHKCDTITLQSVFVWGPLDSTMAPAVKSWLNNDIGIDVTAELAPGDADPTERVLGSGLSRQRVLPVLQ